jgi:hypothetical protein
MIQVLLSGSRLPLCARASNVGSQENGAPACAEVANASANAPSRNQQGVGRGAFHGMTRAQRAVHAINLQRPVEVDTNSLMLRPLSGPSRHSGTHGRARPGRK